MKLINNAKGGNMKLYLYKDSNEQGESWWVAQPTLKETLDCADAGTPIFEAILKPIGKVKRSVELKKSKKK